MSIEVNLSLWIAENRATKNYIRPLALKYFYSSNFPSTDKPTSVNTNQFIVF